MASWRHSRLGANKRGAGFLQRVSDGQEGLGESNIASV